MTFENKKPTDLSRQGLTLVQQLVDREMVRLRQKDFPFPTHVAIRVLWECKEDTDRYGEFFGSPESEGAGDLPQEVVLYAKPLIGDFGTGRTLAREVRITLLHELAHAHGASEEDVEQMGLA